MKARLITAILILSAVLSGCAAKDTAKTAETAMPVLTPNISAVTEYKKTVYAMDTVMDLKVYAADDEILNAAEQEIYRIEQLLKRSDENSEIYKINSSEKCEITEETAYILNTALETGKETDGAFDISIAPVMDLWGFYGQKFYVPTEAEIAEKLALTDYRKIKLSGTTVKTPADMQIDLGGIGKGYTSDRVIELMRDNGAKSAIISLGGNVQTLGTKPDGSAWNIGIQNPFNTSEYIGGIRVADEAVITSGGYQRYFMDGDKRYHHIIDPKTGKPSESGLSLVTIVSESGIRADALSTSLFVMGLEKSSEYWRKHGGFEAVLVTDADKIYVTEGLKDRFKSDREYELINK